MKVEIVNKTIVVASIHTPGPLEYCKSSSGLRSIVDTAGRRLASVHGLYDGVDNDARCAEADANGTLFASAPALLEALQDLLEYTDAIRLKGHGDNLECKAARAAIAQAERGNL